MSSEPIKDRYADADSVAFLVSEIKELNGIVNSGLTQKDKEILELSKVVEDGIEELHSEISNKTDTLYDHVVRMRKEMDILQESNALWKAMAITALCAAISSLVFFTVHIF